MKKTVTINLGSFVFHIDEDAYELLKNYLDNLKAFFTHQEGGFEVIEDIEGRFAELLTARIMHDKQAVTIQDIEEIISQVGQPEEIAGVSEEAKADAPGSTAEEDTKKEQPGATFQSRPRRKLFRSQQDRIIGGVTGGLAIYLDMDASILRVILLLLLFLTSGTLGWVYLAFWIFVPEAKTAIQKLQMMGEPVTVENIGRTIHEESTPPFNFKDQTSFLDKFIYIVGVILKACIIGVVIVLTPVWFVLLLTLVILLVVFLVSLFSGGAYALSFLGGEALSLMDGPMFVSSLTALILTAIPMGVLLFYAFRKIFHWTPLSTRWKWVLFVLWCIALVVLIATLPMVLSSL